MHDCEQEFYIQVECHFDEAMFLVNDEIRDSKFFGLDSHFPGVEMFLAIFRSFIYLHYQTTLIHENQSFWFLYNGNLLRKGGAIITNQFLGEI
jgi:hypothetical protein